jgi:hypothetical protein
VEVINNPKDTIIQTGIEDHQMTEVPRMTEVDLGVEILKEDGVIAEGEVAITHRHDENPPQFQFHRTTAEVNVPHLLRLEDLLLATLPPLPRHII